MDFTPLGTDTFLRVRSMTCQSGTIPRVGSASLATGVTVLCRADRFFASQLNDVRFGQDSTLAGFGKMPNFNINEISGKQSIDPYTAVHFYSTAIPQMHTLGVHKGRVGFVGNSTQPSQDVD